MRTEILEKIKEKYGSRATDSSFECGLYSRDLGPVPGLLVNPLFNTTPDLVVRPSHAEEVAEILRTAYGSGIPVTPRAGASTVYFDSVPIKGGIVMDVNLLRGIVELNEEKMTVKVRSATTWSELEGYLNRKGLACKSYPSSAPAATVGGWLCMMGYGLGSLKYGSMLSQIKSIEVVLPAGEIRTLTSETEPSLDWFAGSEGTLGVVTEVEIEVRRLTAMEHFMLLLADESELLNVMQAFMNASVTPYNLHFADQHCLRAMDKLGFGLEGVDSGCTLGIDYEGTKEELEQARKTVEAITSENEKVTRLEDEVAELEWDGRFKALKLKRGGPGVLGAEVWLPVKELAGYLAEVQTMGPKYHVDLFSYGHVVTPEYITVMTTFYADETRTIPYIINLSLVKKIQDVGYRHGGCPYGVGLWNTPYLNRIYESARLAELRKRKQQLDPKGLMNPGKVYRPPFLMQPFTYGLGMDVMAGVQKLVGRGGSR